MKTMKYISLRVLAIAALLWPCHAGQGTVIR